MKTMLYNGKEYKVPTKKMTLAYLRDRISRDNKWALRALNVIYENQTYEEQSTEQTKEHNNIGFSSFDASFLTSLQKADGALTLRQLACLRNKIKKYSEQIYSIITEQNLEKLHGYVIRDVVLNPKPVQGELALGK